MIQTGKELIFQLYHQEILVNINCSSRVVKIRYKKETDNAKDQYKSFKDQRNVINNNREDGARENIVLTQNMMLDVILVGSTIT